MDTAIRSFRRKRFILMLTAIFVILFFAIRIGRNRTADTAGENSAPVLLPVHNNFYAADDRLSFRGKVNKGENLYVILSKEKIDNSLVKKILSKAGELYNTGKIRAGNSYLINYDVNGFHSFRYDIDKNRYLYIFRTGNRMISGKIVVIPYKIRIGIISGCINGSLYETLASAEEGGGVLSERLALLYEYDIDFNRDIRKGDSFRILIEKKYLKGKFSGFGRILASEFINRGKKTNVVRFASEPGKSSYFHPDGRAVKKMFLRCPLPFMRITSRFGFRRHPVLGFSAAHKGVDLGAPRGTIVRVTADGRVFGTGYDRVRGRYIIVSHGNRYRTHYYHLSGIKKGIRRGKLVSQGNIIGYVGTTGRSTGPHLHYGLQRNGRFINPLLLNSPSRNPVKKMDKKRFNRSSGAIFALMNIGEDSILNDLLKQIIFKVVLYLVGDNI